MGYYYCATRKLTSNQLHFPNNDPIMSNLEELKQDICDIGKRIYAKSFAAANEGNISIRVDENTVLCTPTRHCKGFMTPDDICTVDMDGNQTAGRLKRTSEVLLHLEIYRRRADIKSVVHCHPPHATAFGVAREPIPNGVLPEPDIFLGEIPIAPYETPGSQNFAETILPFVDKTNIIVLANHGTVSYEADIETAYWLTEILDAYCKILILAKQLGGINYVPLEKVKELLAMRKDWGFSDSRDETDDKIADFASFKSTWPKSMLNQTAFQPHPSVTKSANQSPLLQDHELDALAERVARLVVEKTKNSTS
ncbi:MAG: L-fuculose-phosphate aldolase [Mariniblastus sp.]